MAMSPRESLGLPRYAVRLGSASGDIVRILLATSVESAAERWAQRMARVEELGTAKVLSMRISGESGAPGLFRAFVRADDGSLASRGPTYFVGEIRYTGSRLPDGS